MFITEEMVDQWIQYINEQVGENTEAGAIVFGEKGNGLDVVTMGSDQDTLEVLAAMCYNYSKQREIAFEEVLSLIDHTWSELKKKGGQARFGDEVIDMQSGFGYNPETDMVSFPIAPKEVQEQMIASFKETQEKLEPIREKLKTKNGCKEVFAQCPNVKVSINDDKTHCVEFTYMDQVLVYSPENRGMITLISGTNIMTDELEEDQELYEITSNLIAKAK